MLGGARRMLSDSIFKIAMLFNAFAFLAGVPTQPSQ
jgi:hypothetical protein